MATVYAIIDVLKKRGLVEEVRIKPDCSRFELRTSPHHHLFCRKRGRIFDVIMPPCPALKKRKVDGHRIERNYRDIFTGSAVSAFKSEDCLL